MVNQQLVEYIQREEHEGYSDQQLHDALLQQGYAENDIQESIATARSAAQQQPVLQANQPVASQAPGFKDRNVVVQVVLSIVTFGIWGLVWLVRMTKDLKRNGFGQDLNPNMLWLLLIPVVNVVIIILYMVKLGKAVSDATGFDKTLLIVLLILFNVVGMVIAQLQLNKKAAPA